MSETTDLMSYLRQTDGITENTINSLSFHGFNSSTTLMAMDIQKDIPQLTGISLGQRALLRNTLKSFKIIYCLNRSEENHSANEDREEGTCDENRCQNHTIVNKIKDFLRMSPDNSRKYRLALFRSKSELTKLKEQNLSKDVELKRLNSEIFRLRNRNNDKNSERGFKDKEFEKLEKTLKEKDSHIKSLEEKVLKLQQMYSDIIDQFKDWRQTCVKDLQRLKTYAMNESLVIHRKDLIASEESGSNLSVNEPPQLQSMADESAAQTHSISEPTNRTQTQDKSKDMTSELTDIYLRKESEEDVSHNNNNSINYIQNYSMDESLIAGDETSDIEEIPINTTSQVLKVSKEMTFQYLSPISGSDHNYYNSAMSEPSVPSVSNLPNRDPRSRRNSEIGSHNKRETSSKKTNDSKRLKSTDSEEFEDDNPSTNLVLFSTDNLESTAIKEMPQNIRRDSWTLSSIRGSKLISIDINRETDSDGNITDNSPTLRQNVDSSDVVSQIQTSNGYLSDSNEENRCSIVNAAARISSTAMCTRSSGATAVQPRVQQSSDGFKCSLPDCDFVTIFKAKFDDHIRNHVTYHFGQEIPDFWRPYFEEFKKDLPKFKSN